jgi:hypothetical protein
MTGWFTEDFTLAELENAACEGAAADVAQGEHGL